MPALQAPLADIGACQEELSPSCASDMRSKTGNIVAESENIVAATAERIFADLADAQTINRDSQGDWKLPLWQALNEAGLPLSWVPEDCGGSGAGLAEGFSLLERGGSFRGRSSACGNHAGRLAAVARRHCVARWRHDGGAGGPEDRISLDGDGTCAAAPAASPSPRTPACRGAGAGARTAARSRCSMPRSCRIEAGLNLASDGSDTLTFGNAGPSPASRRRTGWTRPP